MIRYNNYGIEANENGGYVLGEIKKRGTESKNPGEEYFIGFCYPSSLKSCFKRILEIEYAKVINSQDFTIKEALLELEKLQNEFQKVLDENVKEELK